ncbi:MAG: hypothetical protein RJB01_294 [Actinomycetota bacterium]|jgi:hypothetical protein
MRNGPLIPGIEEYDRPPRRVPRIVWVLLASFALAVAFMLALGLLVGTGPLRALGLVESELQPVSYRPTADAQIIGVAVALPPKGLCPDDEVVVTAFERGPRVEITAKVIQPRNASCDQAVIPGDTSWVDVALANPLNERTVIRLIDRQPLPRDR